MFGTFLSWLNDHTSDVFVVCTANDVSKLPPEFGRSERFYRITTRELATLLAALMYWRDEITQSGNQSASPYFNSIEMPDIKPLTADEIERLSAKLRSLPVTE